MVGTLHPEKLVGTPLLRTPLPTHLPINRIYICNHYCLFKLQEIEFFSSLLCHLLVGRLVVSCAVDGNRLGTFVDVAKIRGDVLGKYIICEELGR